MLDLKEYVVVQFESKKPAVWQKQRWLDLCDQCEKESLPNPYRIITTFSASDELRDTMSAGTWVRAQTDLIWKMIQEWQDARSGEDINAPKFSFADIEADLYEWLEKIDSESQAAPPAGDGWQDKYLSEMTDIMRDADKLFEQGGGGTRHYMRGLFEIMEENGFAIVRLPTPPKTSV